MAEETRTQIERAAPAQWIERLEIFRERFRLGLIDEKRFKEISRAFQLKDDRGHLWMPGASSNQWYRWDRTLWNVATPPAQLIAADLPLAISVAWNPVPAPPGFDKTPAAPSPAPGAMPPPPRVETPPPPSKSPVTPSAPPSELPESLAKTPPAPPSGARKRALPTDLPERGVTRGRTKPTDLPH